MGFHAERTRTQPNNWVRGLPLSVTVKGRLLGL